MKALIAIGAVTVGLGAFALRPREEPRVVVQERRVEVPVLVEVPVERPVVIERERVVTKTVEKPSPLPETVAGSIGETSRSNMLFLFDREFWPTPGQRRHIEAVLDERQREIEALNARIRASGVFDTRAYDQTIRAMQAESYRRMAEGLDPDRYRKFMDLLAEGRIGDAVGFDIPEGLVVLE